MKRAAKGGEFGANGEWYEGGKFINTVPQNPKRHGSNPRRKLSKQEIAPFTWELQPSDEVTSIFRQFSGIYGRVVNGVAVMRTDDGLARSLEYCGTTLEQAQMLIDSWNAGERWIRRDALRTK